VGVNAVQAENGKHKKVITEKRENLRLTYSSPPCPAVVIEDQRHSLIDISIKAIKFGTAPESRLAFPLGRFLNARIVFQDGESQDVAGSIIRNDVREAVLQLQHAISSARIFKERRYLIEKSRSGN